MESLLRHVGAKRIDLERVANYAMVFCRRLVRECGLAPETVLLRLDTALDILLPGLYFRERERTDTNGSEAPLQLLSL